MKMPPFDKKKLQMIVIAVAMGLVAIFLINKYTEQRIVSAVDDIARRQQAASAQGYANVVVAVKEIPRGKTIDRNMVNIKQVPPDYVQPGTLTSPEAAFGKMAVVDILPGEQVTASKLGSTSAAPGTTATVSSLSLKTPPGKRAVTILIETLAASDGMVKPGDYVDIIGNFPVPQMVEGKITSQLATVTLFQNVLILAIGGQMGSAPSPQAQQTSGPVQVITFALPPKEAELLLFASQQGKLTLILRPPLDTATSTLPVATWDALLQHILSQQGQQPGAERLKEQPALQPSSLKEGPVEIYRAGSLEKREEKKPDIKTK